MPASRAVRCCQRRRRVGSATELPTEPEQSNRTHDCQMSSSLAWMARQTKRGDSNVS